MPVNMLTYIIGTMALWEVSNITTLQENLGVLFELECDVSQLRRSTQRRLRLWQHATRSWNGTLVAQVQKAIGIEKKTGCRRNYERTHRSVQARCVRDSAQSCGSSYVEVRHTKFCVCSNHV